MNSENRPIVAKFGGSSLANAERIKKVSDIADANPDRRFVVLSAPGKRHQGDTKVTDLLLAASEAVNAGETKLFKDSFNRVASRFADIGMSLGQEDSVSSLLDEVRGGMEDGKGRDWAASRGEWMAARMFAVYTGRQFIDAEQVIRIDESGKVDPKSYQHIEEAMGENNEKFVIPGFYGQDTFGEITVFSRGGSDITGAIVARGVGARVYENWTDVDGIRFTDPRRVPDARFVDEITYAELRELGNGGSEVLHKDAVLPVKKGKIPINLRNTFNPNHPGTMIVTERESSSDEHIVGIAGKEGFVSIQVSKDGMNEEEGVVGELLLPFHVHGIPFEHIPTGQDSVSLLVHKSNLQNGHKEAVLRKIKAKLKPDKLEVVSDIGLITLVGQSIRHHNGPVNELLYSTLNKAEIETNANVSPVHGDSIVVGVEDGDVTPAIQVLYERFSSWK